MRNFRKNLKKYIYIDKKKFMNALLGSLLLTLTHQQEQKGMARYAVQLLAPAEGFSLKVRFFSCWPKKTYYAFVCCQFRQFSTFFLTKKQQQNKKKKKIHVYSAPASQLNTFQNLLGGSPERDGNPRTNGNPCVYYWIQIRYFS